MADESTRQTNQEHPWAGETCCAKKYCGGTLEQETNNPSIVTCRACGGRFYLSEYEDQPALRGMTGGVLVDSRDSDTNLPRVGLLCSKRKRAIRREVGLRGISFQDLPEHLVEALSNDIDPKIDHSKLRFEEIFGSIRWDDDSILEWNIEEDGNV